MRKHLLVIAAALLLVACGDKEEELTTEELKQSIKESEEELKETRRSMNKKSDDESEPSETKVVEEESTEENEENEENEDEQTNDSDENVNVNDIGWKLKNLVDSDLSNTTITDLRINKDASTDEERYIVLVDLEWDVKNKPKTTKDMLDMYSDHLAAKLADDKLIYNLVLFWTVPYHNEGESILKKAYENKDKGMYLKDEVKDISVFE